MKNNNDFLRQFFKEQHIFQQDESINEQTKTAQEIKEIKEVKEEKTDTYSYTNINTKEFTSHKHINLKALFKTIEEEKEKIQKITKTTTQQNKNKKEELKNTTETQEKTTIIKTREGREVRETREVREVREVLEEREFARQNRKEVKEKREIEEVKKEILEQDIKRNKENKKPEKNKIHTISNIQPFQTTRKKQKKSVHKTQQQVQQNTTFYTNFQKFEKQNRVTNTKKSQKNTQKEPHNKNFTDIENIEDIASFNEITHIHSKKIALENILGSKSRGTGKNRLSRIDENNKVQKEYRLDLWEKYPERYSKHDQIDTAEESKIQKIQKNQEIQELKKNIIKEFNSYSNLFNKKITKTRDFFTQYLSLSKNLFSENIENYKKQRKLKNIKQQQEKIAKQKLVIIQEKERKQKEKRLQEIQKEKKQSPLFREIKEWIKISGLVAGVFIIGTFSLRAPGFIAQYEEYLNPLAFSEQQTSLENLLQKNENPFKNVESLPVAGIKNNAKDIETNAFLTITPPDRRLVIPKIAKNIPILDVDPINLENGNFTDFEADVQKMLKDGVIHYPGTAEPGQNGNVFITGHSSYYPWDNGKYKDVFAALHNLSEGDEYYIFDKGKKYKYVIRNRKVVSPTDVSVLDQNYNKKTSTLMTCTPVGTAKNRLILQSDFVESGY